MTAPNLYEFVCRIEHRDDDRAHVKADYLRESLFAAHKQAPVFTNGVVCITPIKKLRAYRNKERRREQRISNEHHSLQFEDYVDEIDAAAERVKQWLKENTDVVLVGDDPVYELVFTILGIKEKDLP